MTTGETTYRRLLSRRARRLGRVARRASRQVKGEPGAMPTRDQLARDAMRRAAAAALVVLAAGIVNRVGESGQQWAYVAIAGSLVPQLLVDVLAVKDRERRRRLRTSRRPAPLPLLAATVLVGAATVTLLSGAGAAAWIAGAGLCAAAGLALAASPTTITFAAQTSPRRS